MYHTRLSALTAVSLTPAENPLLENQEEHALAGEIEDLLASVGAPVYNPSIGDLSGSGRRHFVHSRWRLLPLFSIIATLGLYSSGSSGCCECMRTAKDAHLSDGVGTIRGVNDRGLFVFLGSYRSVTRR
jgi:hypothetical protein